VETSEHRYKGCLVLVVVTADPSVLGELPWLEVDGLPVPTAVSSPRGCWGSPKPWDHGRNNHVEG